MLLATLIAAIAFAAWPGLDLAASALFHQPGGLFVAVGWAFYHVRRTGDFAPFVICFAMSAVGILKSLGLYRFPAPSLRGVIFLVVSFTLGPGLLVNVGLKDHWHRPRPGQIVEFGGKATFQPFYRFDGGCHANCSFVSGEVASAAWTLAPALLAPPPLRTAAVAASFVFALAMSLLRIAAGGHFLSDAVFAILFTALVVLLLERLIRPTDRGRGLPAGVRHL